jgi:hypothetical protein
MAIGALMIGGERVFLTIVRSFPLMSRNMPYSPLITVC